LDKLAQVADEGAPSTAALFLEDLLDRFRPLLPAVNIYRCKLVQV
jgi:hypothetical protein